MTRPSVGKEGAHGKFEVEVTLAATHARSIARRFKTEEEAKDFFDRTCNAYQQKANRERKAYAVSFYETKNERSTEVAREIESRVVEPLR